MQIRLSPKSSTGALPVCYEEWAGRPCGLEVRGKALLTFSALFHKSISTPEHDPRSWSGLRDSGRSGDTSGGVVDTWNRDRSAGVMCRGIQEEYSTSTPLL